MVAVVNPPLCQFSNSLFHKKAEKWAKHAIILIKMPNYNYSIVLMNKKISFRDELFCLINFWLLREVPCVVSNTVRSLFSNKLMYFF